MTSHRAVIAVGPDRVRRLCCGAGEVGADAAAALEAVDDSVVLVDERPVAVDELWSSVLSSLAAGHCGLVVVHPSWWPAARVGVARNATRTLGEDVDVQPRSWLLSQPGSEAPSVVVEIADRLVAVTGLDVVAVSRRRGPEVVTEEVASIVARRAATMQRPEVLIDAPSAVGDAARLATLIARAVPEGATIIDDDALGRRARAATMIPAEPVAAQVPPHARGRAVARFVCAGIGVSAVALALSLLSGEDPRRAVLTPAAPTTVLVEGRVALTIPANWLTQRVVAGPGSARVQVTSPADPEVALHVTQTPTPAETLADAADRLKRAILAEPAGVFVDFNPSGFHAGRPVVTYREVRAVHDVRWTVLVDRSVRISIGCQSRRVDPDSIRETCEQAVRSAHSLE
ncbi:type VII secretion-associated protein [Mycobacterium asiaticum]|uniref:Type VII secretion-associated protein n=1 Tax=Mycobacterium asiaticum TaxID=1790 RepID=A0A1A3P8E6_MYCAS|nr:type VII secretion-associated protein [Mycobacterium asiaticum]OBK29945.1 type VII secretion-associated protein [Mycobacterium asiaticum]